MDSYEPHYYEFADGKEQWSSFPRRKVAQYLHAHSGDDTKILDIGCGTSEILRFLPSGISYVGVERSRFATEEAQRRWNTTRPNACFLIDDKSLFSSFPEAHFDVILMLFSLEHVVDPKRYLFECARMLKSGGDLIILTPNLEFPCAWPNALRHRSMFYRAWFTILRVFDYVKRVFGIYTFRTIKENFSEHTGRYEKKDDDLRHVVSSWEVIRFLEKKGVRLVHFWEDQPLRGWRKIMRFLPTLRWYGAPLVVVFRK
jgi:SAM-dependent methyltransferase